MKNDPISTFSRKANATIDQAKPGQRIDRIQVAQIANADGALSVMDSILLIGIVCRMRHDVHVTKGKTGGTFKK